MIELVAAGLLVKDCETGAFFRGTHIASLLELYLAAGALASRVASDGGPGEALELLVLFALVGEGDVGSTTETFVIDILLRVFHPYK